MPGSGSGSPPRVRSRRAVAHDTRVEAGITSACAEQTRSCNTPRPRYRDHLRVCGADTYANAEQAERAGSPPRVRSRRWCRVRGRATGGITSACAEQTKPEAKTGVVYWDHLRVCGADSAFHWNQENVPGSPPRVRSRQRVRWPFVCSGRITSACAEQTSWEWQCSCSARITSACAEQTAP